MAWPEADDGGDAPPSGIAAPTITPRKGGGAIRSIGETFGASPVTGTGTMTVPVPTTPGRSAFGPQLALTYDSGSGNGIFGLGWNLSIPSIARRLERRLPTYTDEADTFVVAGSEDLVPALVRSGGALQPDRFERVEDGTPWLVERYRPRIEGAFARIERWTNRESGEAHWRTISRDNVTTLYGTTPESRIADPSDPLGRVLSWLACESYDDRGNAILYRYKPEDSAGVDAGRSEERNRTELSRSANRYPKRILYGNRTPRQAGEDLTTRSDWLFEAVFDYGEHDQDAPAPTAEPAEWPLRPDPFSTYRQRFELRTYRLCRRVLMFHHFPDEPGIGDDCLVRSLDIEYDESAVVTKLVSLLSSGYVREGAGYRSKSLPPLELSYSPAEIHETVQELDPRSEEHLPYGVDGAQYRFVDLDGEGMAGILSQQAGAWLYKRNLGGGRFGPVEVLPSRPSPGDLGPGADLLVDLAGDGRLDVVRVGDEPRGFAERTDAGSWDPLRAFASMPNAAWHGGQARLMDVTGDGLGDLLLAEDDVLTSYTALGEDGFAPAVTVRKPVDAEAGPAVAFEDGSQSIRVADMSGDGLADLVRVRNGEVCYWPNLGLGRFGAKVTMSGSPWFDAPDRFDERRVRFADLDGSGVADVVYLHPDGPRIYANEAGNGWAEPHVLGSFPELDDVTAVDAVDLLGNGTACLVWSSPLPAAAASPLRYVDLMGGRKPHLLTGLRNNLGAETTIEYAPSTTFYRADQAAGRPWLTRLPFPVQCVRRVELVDRVTDYRFVNRYEYHHGHYDPVEREFRGFGLVDQYDAEAVDAFVDSGAANAVEEALLQPPVLTRTWFHTGAAPDPGYREEYYENSLLPEHRLPVPELPTGLSPAEWREAARALKGSVVRREIYSPDGSEAQSDPYTVAESSFRVEIVQPRLENAHACFLPSLDQTVAYHYDRRPADPRIAHNVVLASDELGNVTRAASVTYPRRAPDPSLPPEVQAAQAHGTVVHTETDYTADVDREAPMLAYRLRTAFASRSFEITGATPATGSFFTSDELATAAATAAPIPFEASPSGALERRPIAAAQTRFLADDLSGPLPAGQLGALGLLHQTFQLAFTPSLVSALYGPRVDDALLTASGYSHVDGDPRWWIPSGTAIYPADAADHFFLATGTRDPLGNDTVVEYDPYDLLPVATTDPLGNRTTAEHEYRLLGPVLVTDPNLNRMAAEADELGFVVKTAVMGKAGAGEGDTLDDPTTRLEYDVDNWRVNGLPNYTRSFAREEHGPANLRWQETYSYAGGTGHVVLTKVQAEPGLARRWNPQTETVEEIDTTPDVRWVGTGRTVVNNKGNPVKRFDPYFSVGPDYDDEPALVETGPTAVITYDPLGRTVRTDMPNGTHARVEFDPWTTRTFDAGDTVKQSRWYSDRGSPDPDVEPEPADPERRAAWLSARHADTPMATVSDPLGRAILGVFDNGPAGISSVRAELDVSGNSFALHDARERAVASTQANFVGVPAHAENAERGERWLFVDVLGRPVRLWDGAGRRIRSEFDALGRTVSVHVLDAAGVERLVAFQVYGERHPDAAARNLRGNVHLVFDQAGLVGFDAFDFKGTPDSISRRFATEFRDTVDWGPLAAAPTVAAVLVAADALLEAETFTATIDLDAMGRPKEVRLPEGTTVRHTYNVGNYLETLAARIRGQGPLVTFVAERAHDASGQLTLARLGNGTATSFSYDPETHRLRGIRTDRSVDGAVLQDLSYVHDALGHVVQARDAAQQTHFFANAVVPPEWRFEYDALHQLVRATGREHASGQPGPADTAIHPLPHPNDATAVRNYVEQYEYDELGNILRVRHVANGGGWTRGYRYAYQEDPANRTNQLLATSLPGDGPGVFSAAYQHDGEGNVVAMPHLASLEWDHAGQLRSVDLGGGGTAHYVYSSGGKRLRKVIERPGGTKLERIYLGAVEIFRESNGGGIRFERQTVRILDSDGDVARVDTKTVDVNDPGQIGQPAIRYLYRNHLGSTVLELDAAGSLVSYEEFHPFGTSAYRSGRSAAEVSLKRYRFAKKERDEETGLDCYGARYLAPWLGRWTSADPAGFADGLNLFAFAGNDPVDYVDRAGLEKYRVPLVSSLVKFQRDPNADPTPIKEYMESGPVTIEGKDYYVWGGRMAFQEGEWWYLDAQLTPVEGTVEVEVRPDAPSGGGGGASVNGNRKEKDKETPAPNPLEPVKEGTRAAATPRAATKPVPNAQRPTIANAHPEAARNYSPGQFLDDIYNLWSKFPEGLESAVRSPGFIMEDTTLEQTADDIARRLGYSDRYAVPPGTPEFDQVWHPTSDSLATRAGISQTPVQSHGLDVHPTPEKTVQVTREIPRIQTAGGVMAQLGKLSGILTIAAASQVDNPWVKGIGIAAGSIEFMAGNVYLYGMATIGTAGSSSAALMAGARMVGGAAGGIGMAVLAGYSAYRAFERGDYVAGGFDTAAAVGGVLIAAGAIFAAPGLVIAGAILGLFALGFHLGRWLDWW